MKIELTVIEDLGIKLYGRLPPVISEIISNAWDADATTVEIYLQEGDIDKNSKIIVKDNGDGMSYNDIANRYLRIGRKRRNEDKTDETPKGRKVIGRKGIGKLAIFGVAKNVEIKTIKNKKMNVFQMNIEDILREAKKSGTYMPKIISSEQKTQEIDGTTVTLTALKRKSPIDPKITREDIAKHFSVIDKKFNVYVNDKRISSSDKFKEGDMEYVWKYTNKVIDKKYPDWKISGWIGATKNPLNEKDLGLTILARGKLIQKPTLFEMKPGGKYTFSYITGEINAEFLDMEEDLTSTNRQSLIWDELQGEILKKWGVGELGKISTKLTKKRKNKREKVIREDPILKPWINSLGKNERKLADKVINAIASSEKLDNKRRKELARYMMTSFDQQVYRDMVTNLDDHPDPVLLLEMFEYWDIVEAREITRIVKGRLDAIGQLGKHIDKNSKEIPTLHKYFKKWPWILEPTWTRWQDEVRFSKLLIRKFPDKKLDEKDRRIDFISIGVGDTIHVVELKRPGYKIKNADFDQLTDYVGFMREQLGNTPGRGYNAVAGYMVCGDIQQDRITRLRIQSAEKDRMYVKKYEELIVVARQLHEEFEKKLDEFKKKE